MKKKKRNICIKHRESFSSKSVLNLHYYHLYYSSAVAAPSGYCIYVKHQKQFAADGLVIITVQNNFNSCFISYILLLYLVSTFNQSQQSSLLNMLARVVGNLGICWLHLENSIREIKEYILNSLFYQTAGEMQ